MKKDATGIVFVVLGLLLFGVIFWMAKSFLIAIVTGGMMALILSPFYNWLNLYFDFRHKKFLSAGIVTSALALLVLVPLILLAVVALRDASQMVAILMQEDSTSQLQMWWQDVIAKAAAFLPIAEVSDIEEHAYKFGSFLLGWTSDLVIRIAADVPALLLQITLGTLSCFFFLLDGQRFIRFLKMLVPFPDHIRQALSSSFSEATRVNMLASLVAALVQAAIVAITFGVLGIPAIALATGATFVFAWIPVVGSIPVFLVAGTWLASLGMLGKVSALIVLSVLTGLADNVVRPLILRGGSDMHPLISLVAILGGIEMFGLLGVMIGPVIVALFLACARIWPAIAKNAGWVHDDSDESVKIFR